MGGLRHSSGAPVTPKEAVAPPLGHDPLDEGSLTDSWHIEPDTPTYAWPYVPKAPEGLTHQGAKKWNLEHWGELVSAAKARELINKT